MREGGQQLLTPRQQRGTAALQPGASIPATSSPGLSDLHPTAPLETPHNPGCQSSGGSQPSPSGQDEATSKAKLPACLLANTWETLCL